MASKKQWKKDDGQEDGQRHVSTREEDPELCCPNAQPWHRCMGLGSPWGRRKSYAATLWPLLIFSVLYRSSLATLDFCSQLVEGFFTSTRNTFVFIWERFHPSRNTHRHGMTTFNVKDNLFLFCVYEMRRKTHVATYSFHQYLSINHSAKGISWFCDLISILKFIYMNYFFDDHPSNETRNFNFHCWPPPSREWRVHL